MKRAGDRFERTCSGDHGRDDEGRAGRRIGLPGQPAQPGLRRPDREQELLRELTRNGTNEEIAARLNISVNTVRTHIQHMLEKTGFRNRIDLAVNAKTLGLVVHEDDRTENRPQKGGNRT